MNKLIIIGLNHPEPDTTAAGNRMMQLIDLFSSHDYQITFLCAQPPSERSFDLTSIGIKTKLIQLNHSSFDKLIKELNPDVVLFDRFITEEQYGWRVAEQCPNSLRILDTEDLHFLRKAREEAVIKGNDLDRMDLYSESALREIASIYRCDLSLIISEIEMELLTNDFNIISELLYYFPFIFEKIDSNFQNGLKSFEQREGFIFIGNFKHAPNMDSILYLKERIWPLIKKEIPDATLSVYGAYASESINLLHDEGEGFLIKGWTENVDVVMEQARICLAPLRFGAGLKGKVLDAMKNGTPCVTTSIGAEGIHGDLKFFGIVADDPQDIAESAVTLYRYKDNWVNAQQNGFDILQSRFQKNTFSDDLILCIKKIHEQISNHRNINFIGRILQHQTMRSTKYLSKWIEEKNS